MIMVIDRICDYYKKNEPSSPVPLVLRRAQRLVKMEFMEILKDMTPSGVAEAEQLGGIRTES